MSSRRQFAIVSAATVTLAVFVATVPVFRHFFDLGVYRGAVHSWLVNGGDLYDYLYQGSEYGFTYPPFAALVFSPLAGMPWRVSIAASLVVNVACVVLFLRWQFTPIVQARNWPRAFAFAVAFLAVVAYGPAEDTFSFGQINLVLLVLVCADLRALQTGRWSAGVGIGLAAAIKLTPFVFIGYLVLSRQYRAALNATLAAAGATILALVLAPQPSLEFWTHALWDTGRVGRLEYVSNQSLRGLFARLDAPATWWLVAVTLVVAFWAYCVRFRDPSPAVGFAMTAMLACLISPVTWVHHLVWLLPALFLLLERALVPSVDRRRLIMVLVVGTVLSSSMVWLWSDDPTGPLAFVGANAFVWVTLGLLVAISPVINAINVDAHGASKRLHSL